MPRCRRYHSESLLGLRALKNMPPRPTARTSILLLFGIARESLRLSLSIRSSAPETTDAQIRTCGSPADSPPPSVSTTRFLDIYQSGSACRLDESMAGETDDHPGFLKNLGVAPKPLLAILVGAETALHGQTFLKGSSGPALAVITDLASKPREAPRRDRKRGVAQKLRDIAKYFAKPFLAALAIAVVDSVGLFLSVGFIPKPTLVLILFLEGGLGLLVGVSISLSSTPSVSRASATLFGTDPWSKESEKHAERVGLRWLVGSAILVMIGFLVSEL